MKFRRKQVMAVSLKMDLTTEDFQKFGKTGMKSSELQFVLDKVAG